MSENPIGPFGDSSRRAKNRTRADQPELYKLAYEEGKRTVDDQLAELDSIRVRSVQFLAFVGSASAFLVGTSLKFPDRSVLFYCLAVLASTVTMVTIGLCLSLLLASKRFWGGGAKVWSFRLSPRALLSWIEPDVRPPSESDFYRALADRYETMASENTEGLRDMRRRYVAFLAAAGLQLVLWLLLTWLYG